MPVAMCQARRELTGHAGSHADPPRADGVAGQPVRFGYGFDDPEAEPVLLEDEVGWDGLCDGTPGTAEPWPECREPDGSGGCTSDLDVAVRAAGPGGRTPHLEAM